MERSLDELLAVCERAYAEEKSGTRERSILSMTTKNLRKCLQESTTGRSAGKEGSASASLSSTPAKTAASSGAVSRDRSAEPRTSDAAADTGTVNGSAPHMAIDPRRRLLTSSDSINRLAYAGRVSVVGDRLAQPDKAGTGGNVPRGSAKALITSLELSAVLLNSGVVPTELNMPPPVFDVSQSSSGGAHAFFSRILGGSGVTKTAKTSTTGSLSPAPATMAPSEAAEVSTATPNPSGVAASENVRDCLVDAVLTAAPMVLGKEAADKLLFVFIAALQAAAVPRLSRTSVHHLGDSPDELRFSTLSLHGPRLVRVMHLLYTILTRQGTSLVLLDEVKSVMHQIVKALPKYTELELRTASAQASGLAHSTDPALHLDTRSAEPPGKDLVNVLEFCAAVCRVAPLTNSSAAAPAAGAAGERRVTADEMAPSVLSESSVAPFATFTTLVTSLGFILHIIVNGGHMFRRMEGVIQCIRLSVVPTAVRTSVSNETDVFRLSLNVLLTCCVTFGPHLVNETSTVFRHVYFRVIESKLTSFAYKSMVIEAFRTYIEEPQNLIALFLNYDCNTRSQSIYEEMISYLAALARIPPREGRVGKGKGASPAVAGASAFADPSDSAVVIHLEFEVPEELRRKAMQTLLLVAESNIQWIERFEIDQTDVDPPTNKAGARGDAATNTTITTSGPTGNGSDSQGSAGGPARTSGPGEDVDLGSAPAPAEAGDAAGVFTEASNNPGASDNDVFLQARRYKDALKKFLYLFNEQSNPEGAIAFLKSCVLMVGAEGATTSSHAPAENASPADSTSPPQLQPGSDAARVGETVGDAKGDTGAAGDAALPNGGDAAGTGDAVATPTEAEISEASRVARFLHDHEDWIDKIALGEYFAKSFRKTENRLVFEQWILFYDFTDLKLDEALRLFLGGFKLLGEAQIVDRTMELFAAQYCRQNPTVFTSADTAFILSFSICMLNTDAHSSHIKNKMTVEGFIRNNKGIDEGNDVDPAILTGIYNRITSDEIVLRPSKYVSRSAAAAEAAQTAQGSGSARRNTEKFSGGVLDSIPLLRHFAPIANAITDKVLLPMDAMGNTLFGGAQKKRNEMYQVELRAALREVTEALRSSAALPHSAFVSATSIQNALPMWEVTVDVLCRRLASALFCLFEDSEQYMSASLANQSSSSQGLPADYDPVQAYMKETRSYEYFQVLLSGLRNTVHVCCSFGNVTHSETLLEEVFQMTQLSQNVIMSTSPRLGLQVQVVSVIPRSRLELLVTFLNLYLSHGTSFGARGWQAGYTAMSLIDALANGIEGLWKRQAKQLLERVESGNGASLAVSLSSPTGSSMATVVAVPPTAAASPGDLWFGRVRDVPLSIATESRKRRANILSTIRAIPGSAVDLWLERLFDATQFPTTTQLQMANSLVKVCQKELQHSRTFTLTKLFDFVTVCATFSTRLQWRELWANASVVFVEAGRMLTGIASQALDGLRIIAMTYLMREELLNYSFQKEVLKPFEDILMSNQDIFVRRRVINIMSELIDFRAGHLASGWHVVFTCLSHAAVIPEVVGPAWEVCERAMALHVDHMKDCFSDLVFCLTTFACTSVDEQVPLRGISYLVACGHWLQYGLEAPPPDVREATDVVRWACRFRSADVEAKATQTLGKNLARVTQAVDPLTQLSPLVKPSSYVAKTHYHLWMSLFEGLIPILVVHSSTRVRAHAVCSLCALLRHYGAVFSVEVQDSLFHGTLRPVLATLISHVQQTGDSSVDKTDYRMLVYLALRSLVLACNGCAHLLELCCDTLTHLSSHITWSVEVVENDLVDVWVRVCCDMLAAVATSAAYGREGDREGLVSQSQSPRGLNISTADGASTPSVNAAQRSSFCFFDRSLQGSFSADGTGAVSASLAWLPQPLPEKKDASPFFLGLLHQIQQMGSVDVVHFKRTASWTELHASAAVTTATITLSQPLQTFSLTSLVQQTVLTCLGHGLLGRLVDAVLSSYRDNRDLCLTFTRAIRHAMLGLSFYCVATRDMEGVLRLLDVVQPLSSSMTRVTGCTTTSSSQRRQSQRASGRAGGECGSESARKGSDESYEVDTPLELLLCSPYTAVLLEFIFSFPIDFAEAGRSVLNERVASFLYDMAASRQFCVEQQLEVQSVFAQQAAEKGTRFKPYKGRNFIDIFRCGRDTLQDRAAYYTPDAAPQLRRRKFNEWKYLLGLLAIHCASCLGQASVLSACLDAPQLFQLLAILPSELEETAAVSFLRSGWRELDLHFNMPEEPVMASCLSLLQAKSLAATAAQTTLS